MDDPKDKRAIDDPQLNQDVNFDRKDEEDFDNSDDFHKYDDTDEDESQTESSEKKENQGLNGDDDSVNTQSDFDGLINI